MAYTVSFGSCTKRVNSTSQTYTEVVSASCLLKESTDILRPTFSLSAQIIGDALLTCNYMYVAAFGRYYWITGIQFIHGSWYVSGDVDVLASYKTEIGNTTAYVLRAASEYDEFLPDNHYALENTPYALNDWKATGLDTTGCVVLTVLGNDGSDTECFYIVKTSDWTKIYSLLYTSNFLNDYNTFWLNIAQDIYNSVINPGDYISSALWLPISYSDISVSESHVYIAKTDTGVMGKKINPGFLLAYKSITLTAPDHPQEATNGGWMRGNICCKDQIFLPGYGSMSLDSDVISAMAIRTITVQYAVDCSGALSYNVSYGGIYNYCTTNIGTPCGFGDLRPDVSQAISSVGAVAANAIGTNPLGFIHSIADTVAAMAPKVERISTGGSRTLPSVMPYIILTSTMYCMPSDAMNPAGCGRPLGKTRQISTLSGYVLCSGDVSVSCAGTSEEHDRINNFLTGGFYYE